MWYIGFNSEGLALPNELPSYIIAVMVSYGLLAPATLSVHAQFDHKPTPEDVARCYADVPELYGRALMDTIQYERESGVVYRDCVNTSTAQNNRRYRRRGF